MQTFLPFADFEESARVLDMKRLGKQRVETLQVMTVLCGGLTSKGLPYRGWDSHPAVRMWRGHESDLYSYQAAVCYEWHDVRGYRDTCLQKTWDVWMAAGFPGMGRRAPWLGDPLLHESHRSNLMRKDFDRYAPMFVGPTRDVGFTRLGLDYVWPVA